MSMYVSFRVVVVVFVVVLGGFWVWFCLVFGFFVVFFVVLMLFVFCPVADPETSLDGEGQ